MNNKYLLLACMVPVSLSAMDLTLPQSGSNVAQEMFGNKAADKACAVANCAFSHDVTKGSVQPYSSNDKIDTSARGLACSIDDAGRLAMGVLPTQTSNPSQAASPVPAEPFINFSHVKETVGSVFNRLWNALPSKNDELNVQQDPLAGDLLIKPEGSVAQELSAPVVPPVAPQPAASNNGSATKPFDPSFTPEAGPSKPGISPDPKSDTSGTAKKDDSIFAKISANPGTTVAITAGTIVAFYGTYKLIKYFDAKRAKKRALMKRLQLGLVEEADLDFE